MDLSFSKKLGEVPDLSEATNLQTLDLSYCESIVSLSSSIGELKKLKDLTMFGCTKLEALPTNLDLASLDSLYMDGCSRLKSFPEISRNIQFLYLGETAIEEVPSSITCWTRLLEFNMSGNKRLKTFPHVPESVRVLSLGNNEFENIPAGGIKRMSQLRSLDLTDCKKLVSLPEFPDFLAYINADNCESLERISHLSSNPNIVLELGNCAKLDQESRNLVERSECEYAFLPGKEVPGYFTYRTSSGSSLNIHLDHQNLSLSAVTGFKACVVLAAGSNFDVLSVNGVTGISCCFKGKNNGSSIQYYEWPVMYPSLLLTDHLCILNAVVEDENNDGKGKVLIDQEMCFEFGCPHYKIIGCGVRLLTGREEEESFNGSFGVRFSEVSEEKEGEGKKSRKRKRVALGI